MEEFNEDLGEHYRTVLKKIVDVFNTMNIPSIISCFTEDVAVRYNGYLITGKEDLHAFLSERYADIIEYKLEKNLRVYSASVAGVELVAYYTKKTTGERITVRAHEFLEFEGNKIRQWDYVGHVALA